MRMIQWHACTPNPKRQKALWYECHGIARPENREAPENDYPWKKYAGETKIETVNPTALVLPSNLSQTFASGSQGWWVIPFKGKPWCLAFAIVMIDACDSILQRNACLPAKTVHSRYIHQLSWRAIRFWVIPEHFSGKTDHLLHQFCQIPDGNILTATDII